MGKENSIKTGTTSKQPLGGVGLATYNLNTKLPSSIYQYGIVTAINTATKEITYNVIEDNISINKIGKATPLNPGNIRLPDIGYVVPLLKGPDINISLNSGQYDKTTYYLDPIGIWQNVNENKIQKTLTSSNTNVTSKEIKKTEIGIPKTTTNSPTPTNPAIKTQTPITNPSTTTCKGKLTTELTTEEKIKKEIEYLKTCKQGTNNAFEIACRMNPANPNSPVFNSSLNYTSWRWNWDGNTDCSDNINYCLLSTRDILGNCGEVNCPVYLESNNSRVFCAAGISLCFLIYNSKNLDTLSSTSKSFGGWKKTYSSYYIPPDGVAGNDFTTGVTRENFIDGVDFDEDGYLTNSGFDKYQRISLYKGGIFNYGTGGKGHIGLIYFTELKEIILKTPPKSPISRIQPFSIQQSNDENLTIKYKMILHTLEFNTSVKGIKSGGDSRTGGLLAFSKRDVTARTKNKTTQNTELAMPNFWIADSSIYTGGNWAPGGLGNGNNLIITDFIKNTKVTTRELSKKF